MSSDNKIIDFQHVSWNEPIHSDLEALKEVIVTANETLIPERWYNALPWEQHGLWELKISFKNGKMEKLFKWVGDGKPWIIGATL